MEMELVAIANKKKALETFKTYFKGREDDFSEQSADGSYRPVRRPFTDEDISAHLAGDKTYGLYLIKPALNTCRHLVIDIDTRKKDIPIHLIKASIKIGLKREQILLEFTGNRGYHLWYTFQGDIEAGKLKSLGRIIEAQTDLPMQVEIFPKQDKVGEGGYGNLIKWPFGKHRKSGEMSSMLDDSFQTIDWVDNLPKVEKIGFDTLNHALEAFSYLLPKTSPTTLSGVNKGYSLPCFARIMEFGVSEGKRDNIAFRLAVFFKKQGMTQNLVTTALSNWNKRLNNPPLEDWIIDEKVRSVFEKGYSGYGCDQDYMQEFCSPDNCPVKRKQNAIADKYNLTDLGNAERLACRHNKSLRYCHPWNKWFIWDGKRWAIDDTAEAWRRAIETVRSIYGEAEATDEKEIRKQLGDYAIKCESEFKIKAMLSLASKQRGIPIKPEELDRDPWLINVLNGTIDLRTARLYEHRREDFMTKLASVTYDKQSCCPKWKDFLDKIMVDNKGLIEFLQRVVGYCLTGRTGEHKLFFLFGGGQNGKSTFVKVLQGVLGDYAIKAASELLLTKPVGAHTTDITDLKGARLAITIEVQQGRRLAEAFVKEATGGDTMTGRRMRQDNMTWEPTHKIILAANHKPVIHETTQALWRRIDLIPFNYEFSDNEKIKDYHEILLNEEKDGIFLWALGGVLEWQEKGLAEPNKVIMATKEYRTEMDVLGDFIAECCIIGQKECVTNEDLRHSYSCWCKTNGEEELSPKALSLKLQEKGFIRSKVNAKRGWRGVGLRPNLDILALGADGTDRTDK